MERDGGGEERGWRRLAVLCLLWRRRSGMAESFERNPSEVSVSRRRSPGSDVHADCGAPGALKTDRALWKPRPGALASGRIAEPLLRSTSAPPSFRRGRAGRQLRGAE